MINKYHFFFSECISSYGDNCQYRCDVHCINQTCDSINGSCLYGCIEGEQCDKSIRFCIRKTNKHTNHGLIYMILSLLTKYLIFLTVFFPDYASSSSNTLPVTVAILVCACVFIILGVVITICVIR